MDTPKIKVKTAIEAFVLDKNLTKKDLTPLLLIRALIEMIDAILISSEKSNN